MPIGGVSGWFADGAVAPLGCLGGGADLLPGDADGSCLRNGFEDLLFGSGWCDDGTLEEVLLDGDLTRITTLNDRDFAVVTPAHSRPWLATGRSRSIRCR